MATTRSDLVSGSAGVARPATTTLAVFLVQELQNYLTVDNRDHGSFAPFVRMFKTSGKTGRARALNYINLLNNYPSTNALSTESATKHIGWKNSALLSAPAHNGSTDLNSLITQAVLADNDNYSEHSPFENSSAMRKRVLIALVGFYGISKSQIKERQDQLDSEAKANVIVVATPYGGTVLLPSHEALERQAKIQLIREAASLAPDMSQRVTQSLGNSDL